MQQSLLSVNYQGKPHDPTHLFLLLQKT